MIYHFIYKTTNNINSRFYFGRHSTNKINDSYLGSGVDLNKAIKKYGKENFTREIIEFYRTFEELVEAESRIVTQKFLDENPKCYNRCPGGIGGGNNFGDKNPFYGKTHTIETKLKLSTSASKKIGDKNPFYGKTHSNEWKNKNSENKLGKNKHNDVSMYSSSVKQSEGWWIVPNACFFSSEDAANFIGCSKGFIIKHCKNNKEIASNNYQTPIHFRGKTWEENGFDYIYQFDLNGNTHPF